MRNMIPHFFACMWMMVLCIQTASAEWIRTNGPAGASVRALVIEGSTVFAGVNHGGVFRSTDNGASWTAVNSGIANLDVQSLAIGDGNVYAGTVAGLFHSSNHGESWNQVTTGLTNQNILSLLIKGGTVYAGTQGAGVFRSTDYGATWTAGKDTAWASRLKNAEISCLAASGDAILAGALHGYIYRSIDDGVSWTSIKTGIPDDYISSFWVNGDTVYVGGAGDLCRSTDNGTTWSKVNTIYNVSLYRTIAVSGGIMLADIGGLLFRSDDNGTKWTKVTAGLPYPPLIYSFAVSGDIVFAGMLDAGIYRSADNGATWTSCNSGLTCAIVHSIVVNGTTVIAGTLNNGIHRSTDKGTTWSAVDSGLGTSSIRALAVSGGNVIAGTIQGGVYCSADDGISWTKITAGIPQQTPSDVSILSVQGNKVFTAVGLDGILYSNDHGISWYGTNKEIPFISVSAIAESGGNIIVSTPFDVYLSTDNGKKWMLIDSSLSGFHALTTINNTVIGASRGILLSTDHGMTWAVPETDITNYSVHSFIRSGRDILAGTSNGGIFLSSDEGKNWTMVDSGFISSPNVPIQSLALTEGTLFVGTYGKGVWRRELSEIVDVTRRNNRWRMQQQTAFKMLSIGDAGSVIAVEFTVQQQNQVIVKMYDLAGRELSTLIDQRLTRGTYRYLWNMQAFARSCHLVTIQVGKTVYSRIIQPVH